MDAYKNSFTYRLGFVYAYTYTDRDKHSDAEYLYFYCHKFADLNQDIYVDCDFNSCSADFNSYQHQDSYAYIHTYRNTD